MSPVASFGWLRKSAKWPFGRSTPTFCGDKPYVGLREYSEAEAKLFFGRDDDAALVRNKVYAGPLLVFYASSGVGKTSLLLAKVIPQLCRDGAHVLYFDQWAETDPLDRLKGALLKSTSKDCGLDQKLPERPLVEVVREVGDGTKKPVVLVLDQFEQFLVRPVGGLERLQMELAALVRANLDAHVILSLREEFLGELVSFRAEILNLFRTTFRLEHLSDKGAEEAIIKPAELFNKSYEPSLVNKLLRDLKTDEIARDSSAAPIGRGINLPFLQIVCERLWKEAETRQQKILTSDLYEGPDGLGGAIGILSNYVNEVATGLSWWKKLSLAKILKALAPPSGIKMSYSVEDLRPLIKVPDRRLRFLLKHLVNHRVVRDRSSERGKRYELSHDAFVKVVVPWADAVISRSKMAAIAVSVVVIVCTGLLGIELFKSWDATRRRQVASQMEFNETTGKINRLLNMKPGEQQHMTADIVNSVAGKFLENKNPENVEMLSKELERCKQLIRDYYDAKNVDIDAAGDRRGSQLPRLFTLVYSPKRTLDQNRLKEAWRKTAADLAKSWGIVMPEELVLQKDAALPKRLIRIVASGETEQSSTISTCQQSRRMKCSLAKGIFRRMCNAFSMRTKINGACSRTPGAFPQITPAVRGGWYRDGHGHCGKQQSSRRCNNRRMCSPKLLRTSVSKNPS